MSKIYPKLRVKTFDVDTWNSTFDAKFSIETRFLLLGFFMPEFEKNVVDIYQESVLTPYELAVSKFFQSDYIYDQSHIRSPETLDFDLTYFQQHFNYNSQFFKVILCYLEFPNN